MATKPAAPRLLSGGNPQIPKGDGDAPVQAYIAACPGWKRAVGVPPHFGSSIASGSASWISARRRASVATRQSAGTSFLVLTSALRVACSPVSPTP